MKVEIEGKLAWNERFGSKLKFRSTKKNGEGQTTTLIDFREPEKFQKRLDEPARSLPRAMELENYQDIPVEIPDTATVSFGSTSPSTDSLATCEMESPQDDNAKQKTLGKSTDLPSLEGPRVLQGLENHKIQASQDPTEPTVENITRLIQNMTRPIEQQIIGRPPANSFSSTSNTVIAPEDEQEQMTGQQEETKPALVMTGLDTNQEAMLKILQIPALLTILQLLAALMEMLGRSSKAKVTAS
ncbi:hypothetical protein CEP54_012977 [Fusarium duplospermum]|uniref:Uncharacterized protein n=1 Tax=Fusarium duplospermum TaxID=1325734 RepID=A0A428P5P9_9HYPO|nr:hypothetical protein CEP54_012977 [Fusarium duplospermum]